MQQHVLGNRQCRIRERSRSLPSFLFPEPQDEGVAVCRRVVDAAEAAQRSFLLVAEPLSGDVAI